MSPIAALVLVRDPAAGTDIDPAVVARALDLTKMESRVAVQLARGMSVHEIAAAMGRKESTIRSHVKRTFAKHGLSRQAELVRLVRPSGRNSGVLKPEAEPTAVQAPISSAFLHTDRKHRVEDPRDRSEYGGRTKARTPARIPSRGWNRIVPVATATCPTRPCYRQESEATYRLPTHLPIPAPVRSCRQTATVFNKPVRRYFTISAGTFPAPAASISSRDERPSPIGSSC